MRLKRSLKITQVETRFERVSLQREKNLPCKKMYKYNSIYITGQKVGDTQPFLYEIPISDQLFHCYLHWIEFDETSKIGAALF